MDTTGLVAVAIFAQHGPTEFERDRHYFYDSTGTDIEPAFQEGGDGHDHGDGTKELVKYQCLQGGDITYGEHCDADCGTCSDTDTVTPGQCYVVEGTAHTATCNPNVKTCDGFDAIKDTAESESHTHVSGACEEVDHDHGDDHYDGACQDSKNFPLYCTEEEANAASSIGTSHMDGSFWMPNGGAMYHGNYEGDAPECNCDG